MRVYSDGRVQWFPSVIITSDCDISVAYYPFDTQSCDVELVTDVSFSYEIQLYIDSQVRSSLKGDHVY